MHGIADRILLAVFPIISIFGNLLTASLRLNIRSSNVNLVITRLDRLAKGTLTYSRGRPSSDSQIATALRRFTHTQKLERVANMSSSDDDVPLRRGNRSNGANGSSGKFFLTLLCSACTPSLPSPTCVISDISQFQIRASSASLMDIPIT